MAVEEYNKTNPVNIITAEYRENAAASFYSKQNKSDLIIARELNSPALLELFESWDKELWQKKGIYKGFLKTGMQDGNLKILPFSFDLPVLIYEGRHSLNLQQKRFISLEELHNEVSRFSRKKGANYSSVGFDPGFDMLFPFSFFAPGTEWISREHDYMLEEKGWQEYENFFESWRSLTSSSKWTAFQNKYGYLHPLNKLSQNKWLFMASTLSAYRTLPDYRKQELKILFPTADSLVRATENNTYIGLSSGSDNKEKSRKFINWLLSAENQKTLLSEQNRQSMTGTFLSGKLTSLSDVNEKTITEGKESIRIPQQNQLIFPEAKPPWFSGYAREVLKEELDHLYRETLSFEELAEEHNLWTGLNRLSRIK